VNRKHDALSPLLKTGGIHRISAPLASARTGDNLAKILGLLGSRYEKYYFLKFYLRNVG